MPQPASDPIAISTIKGSKVSEDGRYILLNCQSEDGQARELIVPTKAVANLIANLEILAMSAGGVMQTSDPIEVPAVRFNDPEPVFFVEALGGSIRPETGLLQLRIGAVNTPVFQLSMTKQETQILYNLLLDFFSEVEDGKPN